jgi:hypothetical protein
MKQHGGDRVKRAGTDAPKGKPVRDWQIRIW